MKLKVRNIGLFTSPSGNPFIHPFRKYHLTYNPFSVIHIEYTANSIWKEGELMWSKSRDSFLILVIITICPYILTIFNFPIQTNHKIGLFLIGLAAVMQIWVTQTSEADKIGQVFEAKKVSVEGKFPQLVKGDRQ